jgi:hypothetical protein
VVLRLPTLLRDRVGLKEPAQRLPRHPGRSKTHGLGHQIREIAVGCSGKSLQNEFCGSANWKAAQHVTGRRYPCCRRAPNEVLNRNCNVVRHDDQSKNAVPRAEKVLTNTDRSRYRLPRSHDVSGANWQA